MNTTFRQLGATNHSNLIRAENDFYATDPATIKPLLDNIWSLQVYKVWEPACGNGHLSEAIKNYHSTIKIDVVSSDIIQRQYPCEIIDFLQCKKESMTSTDFNIITNPPYNLATEFCQKALELVDIGCYVAMFLKLTFIESQRRVELFKKYPIKKILVFSKRAKVARNGLQEEFEKSSAICFAWFVWQKGYEGKTILELI